MPGIVQDLRLAARTLWQTRVVSAVAVMSLALGIGANSAIFSILESLALRPLPVRDPAQLALMVDGGRFFGVPYRNRFAVWDEIRMRPDLFGGVAAWSTDELSADWAGQRDTTEVLWVSGSFFDVLGVRPIVGRPLVDADDSSIREHSGAEPAAIVSYAFWQRRFGGTIDVLGRSITLDGVPCPIVGVTPRNFFGPEVGRTFDVILPLGVERRIHGRESWVDRDALNGPLRIVGRLKPGQTLAAATASLRSAQPQIREATMPESWPASQRSRYLEGAFSLASLPDAGWSLRRNYERPLLTLFAVVALVLLVACGNVANLLLARATARRHEMAVRRALGASRWRLVRQLFAESVLLAVVSAALALLFAGWAGQLLVRQIATESNPVFLDVAIDRGAIAFTLAIAVGTVLLFGSAPAMRGSGIVPMDALNSTRATATRGRVAVSGALVVAQVAVSLVLILTAGLLGRTFTSLVGRDLGFDTDNVLMVNLNAQRARGLPTERFQIYERIQEAIGALPGLTDAAVVAVTPIVTDRPMLGQPIERVSGRPPLARPQNLASLNMISPGVFRALRIPLIAGRDIQPTDRPTAPPVGIVNQAFARRFFNGDNPVGQTATLLLPGSPPPPVQIVGLVADTVYGSLRSPEPPTIYLPIAQINDRAAPFLASANLIVRSQGPSSAALAKTIADTIAAVDPQIAIKVHTLDEQVAASLTQERLIATVSGVFGGLALVLAGLGLYGVTAYTVSRRRNEIGIRMALGASPGRAVRLVLGRIALLVAIGVAIGVGAGAWASGLMAALLYGVTPRDPATLTAAVILLVSVSAVAAWIPARRAARVDPAAALRCE